MWVKFFVKKKHEVHVISPKKGECEGIFLHVIPTTGHKTIDTIRGALFVRKLVRKLKPDLVHAHYIIKYGWWGAFANYHPLILTVWGSDVLLVPKKSKLIKLLVKITFKRADLVTTDGIHLIELLKKLGVDPDKLHIVNFGVDVELFKPVPKNENLAKRLGVKDCPVIISLRNLKQIYDIETLIHAVPHILKHIPAAKFLIFGEGEQKPILKELVKSLGIEKNVVFMGFVSNEQMPQYFSLADVYVSTSLSDAGLARSTAEAMACALPVIVTDVGDNRDWVKDGENGFIVPPRNPQALANAVITLIKDPQLRQKFGSKNREIITSRNNYYKEMDKIELLYQNLKGG
jgi:glycosyltransferase involved in cell wall biosynthesis